MLDFGRDEGLAGQLDSKNLLDIVSLLDNDERDEILTSSSGMNRM